MLFRKQFHFANYVVPGTFLLVVDSCYDFIFYIRFVVILTVLYFRILGLIPSMSFVTPRGPWSGSSVDALLRELLATFAELAPRVS